MHPLRGTASVRTDRSRRAAPAADPPQHVAIQRGSWENASTDRPGLLAVANFPRPAGPWHLTRLLSPGGRTIVYRARPSGVALGPGCYAIKTLAVPAERDSIGWARLAREAAAAASVNHPGVVCVLSSHLRGERPYLVQPYLEGATLQQILSAAERRSDRGGRQLAIRFALAIARQAAAGLKTLHAGGWLHGQVSPKHLRISPQGHATLLDLSLARRLQSSECETGPFGHNDAHYAAPETFGRLPCTAASDTYSLGIVLFEMLTGQLPLAAANPLELALLHRTQPPPAIRSLIPHATLELNELVRRMLAKEPLRRPCDEELVRWLAEVEIAELAR